MQKPDSTYHTYLLRLRWMENAGAPVWRVILEEPSSQAQLYFEDVESLYGYLRAHFSHQDCSGSQFSQSHFSGDEAVAAQEETGREKEAPIC